MLDDLVNDTVGELNVKSARLRRRTLLPLILAWGCEIAAIAMSRFTLREYLIAATLTLLGAGTFNYITGWPYRRR